MNDQKQNSKTAIVIGATGLVGNLLLEKLLKDNYYSQVVVFVRNTLKINNPKLIEHVIKFENLSDYSALFRGDSLFCCLGTTIKKALSQLAFRKVDFDYPLNIARLCKANHVNQFLLISSIGANIKSRAFYTRLKGEVEQEIIKLNFDQTSIFRPSFLVGERKENRTGERTGIFFANLLASFPVRKFKKYKPILARTVAEAMLQVSKVNKENKITIYESDQIQRFAGN